MQKILKIILTSIIILAILIFLYFALLITYTPYRNIVKSETWKNRIKQHSMIDLDKIYPEQGIRHYLAMFSLHYDVANKDNYKNFNDLYITIEGIDEFKSLQKEVIQMNKNNHWNEFLQIAIENEIKDIDMPHFKEMMNTILNHTK